MLPDGGRAFRGKTKLTETWHEILAPGHVDTMAVAMTIALSVRTSKNTLPTSAYSDQCIFASPYHDFDINVVVTSSQMQGMDQSSTIHVNPFKQFLHPAKRAVEYLCQLRSIAI